MARGTRGGVLAVFPYLDDLIRAMEVLEASGHHGMTVYTPVPRHELARVTRRPPSPIRRYTLAGGVGGLLGGILLTVVTSLTWPELVTDGKPIASIPPYTVIFFECTVLLGVLSTTMALAFYAVVPGLWGERIPTDPRFSIDRFGIFVPATHADAAGIGERLRDLGAEEVRIHAGT